MRAGVRFWLAYVGDTRLVDITEQHIRGFVLRLRTAGRSDGTIKLRLMALYNVCRFVHRDVSALPIGRYRDFIKLAKVRVVMRPLSVDEEARLLSVAKPWQRDLIVFAIETGLRRSEQHHLRWGNVADDRTTLTVRGKGNKVRTVALSRRAREVLARQPAGKPVDRVFANSLRGLEWWSALFVKTGVPPARWHDLRHTYGTRYIQRGGNVVLLSRNLGHASIAMTQVYANVVAADQVAEQRRIDGALEAPNLDADGPKDADH